MCQGDSVLCSSVPSLLVQCRLDLVADRTARDCYRQEAEELREKVAEGQAQRDAMLTLHRKIQDFQELAVSCLFFSSFFQKEVVFIDLS